MQVPRCAQAAGRFAGRRRARRSGPGGLRRRRKAVEGNFRRPDAVSRSIDLEGDHGPMVRREGEVGGRSVGPHANDLSLEYARHQEGVRTRVVVDVFGQEP